MEKFKLDEKKDDSQLNLNRKVNEEVLEISSTGYGLESVSKDTEEPKKRNPSCGGL
ncbi:hypothetical protein [Neobacillus ginsengisoli]|uniref:Plantaricin C family lantibiotic n=1 Tax=Neobacillus ginsengisoli TaxID=904295 RepID=A0ABT9XY32_9BACI|nr:hypothetical protein [Neobacillus ginsengisoli]MDQ0200175.1 hypothetical protein [Neobacillus ginsengisoli]